MTVGGNIYLIKRSEEMIYETYERAVVVANSTQEARLIHPANTDNHIYKWNEKTLKWMHYKWDEDDGRTWINPSQVIVCLVGVTDICRPGTVICSSYYGT